MIPTWLQQHLEDRGLWDSDGITRAARARRCRTCREYVLAGLDGDRCALPAAVDPDPLTPRGEACALLAGKSTYSLRWMSDRLELAPRGHFEIRGDAQCQSGLDVACPGLLQCSAPDCTPARARMPRHDVLAQHVCGQPSIGMASGLGQPSRLPNLGRSSPAAEPPF